MSSLSLLDFFVKLINNNGNEQVHDKESSQENEDDVNQSDWRIVLNDLDLIVANLIYGLEHHSWPHFECWDFKEGQHAVEDIVVVIWRNAPNSWRFIHLTSWVTVIIKLRDLVISNTHLLRLDKLGFVITERDSALKQLHTKDTKDKQEKHNDEQHIKQTRYTQKQSIDHRFNTYKISWVRR